MTIGSVLLRSREKPSWLTDAWGKGSKGAFSKLQRSSGGRNFLQRPFFPIYVLLGVSFLLIAICFMVALPKVAAVSSEISKIHAELAKQPSGHDFYLFPCGPDTRQWEYFNKKCYYFSLKEMTWNEAKAQCEKQTSQLVVINDLAEQNFLMSRTHNEAYWIGLNDIRTEGTWQWVDGSNYITGFTYWKQGEPNNYQNHNEDCVQVRTKGEWNDNTCSSMCFYICEKPLPSTAMAASKKT
ncbi:hepatic lectin-like [Tiliqua scincoides]|uniref:hepatic lectin-like n=1 Tax=Tiliqua scincoides TaxID=71010 RepID=UPI00346209AF